MSAMDHKSNLVSPVHCALLPCSHHQMVFDEEPKHYTENWDHLIHISIENLGLFSSYHKPRQYIIFMRSHFLLKRGQLSEHTI